MAQVGKEKHINGKDTNVIVGSIVVFFVAICVILVLEFARFKSFCKFDFGALITGFAFSATIMMFYAQSTIMIQQQIENTFFLMLGQWRDIANNIEFGQNWFRGRNVFKDLYNRLIEFNKLKQRQNPSKNQYDIFVEFKNLNKEEYQLLENYYINFIRLLEYIDSRNRLVLSQEKKVEYTKILKAQLSTYEERMLLCHYFIFIINDGVIMKEGEQDSDSQDWAYLIGKYGILNQCIQSILNGTTDDVENEQSMIHYAMCMYSTFLKNLCS